MTPDERIAELEARVMRLEAILTPSANGTPEQRRKDAMGAIMRAVSKRHGVSVALMMSHTKARPVVVARMEAWHMMHEAGFSYPQIGAYCGRDHTTILHGVRRFAEMRNPDR